MHHKAKIDNEDSKSGPEAILIYNAAKVGLDTAEE